MQEVDEAILLTNLEAQTSKLSCVQQGYYQDGFLQYFVRKPHRRPALINRGHYCRTEAILQLLLEFLDTAPGPTQVLSLGAGHDTLFFRLQEAGKAPSTYVEVDTGVVAASKARILQATPALNACLAAPVTYDTRRGRVDSARYKLVACDLRSMQELQEQLASVDFQASRSTFVLAECVLVYLRPSEGKAIVEALAAQLQRAAMVIYEMIRPDDRFGQQMLKNLSARGYRLEGIHGTPTLEAQCERLRTGGWQRTFAADMNTVYAQWLHAADRERVERLEPLDEVEELQLLQGHYCIAVGVKGQVSLQVPTTRRTLEKHAV